ncbi:hypothetical protein GCM10023222_09070 [Saccharopolyspora cebuensis]
MTALRAEDEFLAERKDRFSGAVIGALAGDALGRRVRHLPWSAIEEAFGPRGVTELAGSPPGESMSDGAVAMALTLDGMIKADRALLAGAPDPLIELGRVYEAWASGGAAAGRLASQLPEHLVGSRYLPQLRERLGQEDRFRSDLPEVSPLYSAIPMGLWGAHPVAVFELVDRVMGFTGESETTVGASRAAAVLIQQNIMTGQHVRGFGQVLEADRRHYPASLRKSLEAAETLARRAITPERIESLGTGEDPESALAIAACAVHAAEMDFDEAVRIAVNHSGDSAITGALAGAIMGSSFTGQDRIPVHWASGLMSAKVLVKLANDAGEQFAENPRDDAEWHHRYPTTAQPPESPRREVRVSEREELFLRHWRDFWWSGKPFSGSDAGDAFPRLAEEALGREALLVRHHRVRELWESRRAQGLPSPSELPTEQVVPTVPKPGEVTGDEERVLAAFRELIGDPLRHLRKDVGFLRFFGGPHEPEVGSEDDRMPFWDNWPESAIGLRGMFFGGAAGDAFATAVGDAPLESLVAEHRAGALAATALGATTSRTRLVLFMAEAMNRGHATARIAGHADIDRLVGDAYRRFLQVAGRRAGSGGGWLVDNEVVRQPHPVDAEFVDACLGFVESRDFPGVGSAAGVLTYAAPLSLFWDRMLGKSRTPDGRHEKLRIFAHAVASLTHASEVERLAVAVLSALVRISSSPHPLLRSVGIMHGDLRGVAEYAPVCDVLDRVVRLHSDPDRDPVGDVAVLADHYDSTTALGALAIGLYAGVHGARQREIADALPEAFAVSALHDGDRHATAVVCGQVLGMVRGPGALPRRWIDQLDLRDVLAEMTDDVIVGAGPREPGEQWYARYPVAAKDFSGTDAGSPEEWGRRVPTEPAALPREVRVVVERLGGPAAADSGAGRNPWDLALVRRAFGRSGDGFCEPVKGSAPRLGDVALVHGVRAHFGASVRAAAAADRLARGGAGTSAPVGMLVFCLDALVRAETRQRTEGIVDPRGTALFGLLRWRHALGVPWERVAPGAAEPSGWLPSRAVAPGDPDPVCEGALAEFAAGGGTLRRPVNRARSSSAVLRALGLATWSDEPGEVFAEAVANALLTHGHPDAFLSAGAFATTAQVLLAGGDLDDAIAVVADELTSWPGHEDVRRALDGTAPHGDGAAPDVLAVALGAARERFDDAEAAVRRAIELNPAAAPLVGAMLAASRGEPEGWRVDASLREVLDRLAADVVATRVGSPDRRWDQSWVADYPAT